jgi:hypothetical protein
MATIKLANLFDDGDAGNPDRPQLDDAILPIDTPMEVPDDFTFTFGWWNWDCHGNDEQDSRPGKGASRKRYCKPYFGKKLGGKGKMDAYEYGTARPMLENYGTGTGCKHDHVVQRAIICTPKSRLIVADEDYPDIWKLNGLDLMPTVLTGSGRGRQYYIVVPADLVHLTPTDGPLPGGDLQTNGFVPVPGTIHPDGRAYDLIGTELNIATPELMAKLLMLRKKQDAEDTKNGRTRSKDGKGGGGKGGAAGTQEHTLFRYAGKIILGGASKEEAYAKISEMASSFEVTDPTRPWDTAAIDERFGYYWPWWTEAKSRDQGIEWARNVSAGNLSKSQGKFEVKTKAPIIPETYALTRQNEIRAKLKAEQHQDELSTDWHKAPQGAKYLYEIIMKRLAAGSIVNISDDFIVYARRWHNGDECIEWLTSDEHQLLSTDATTGRVAARSDHLRGGEAEKYPGWKDACEAADVTRLALVGSRWGRKEIAGLVLGVAEKTIVNGKRPSYTYFAKRLQHEAIKRGRNALTAAIIRSAVAYLEETGQLYQAEAGRHYRKGHQWHWHPPKYALGQAPPERQAEIEAAKAERKIRREIRCLVKSLAGKVDWIPADLFEDREVPA